MSPGRIFIYNAMPLQFHSELITAIYNYHNLEFRPITAQFENPCGDWLDLKVGSGYCPATVLPPQNVDPDMPQIYYKPIEPSFWKTQKTCTPMQLI